MAFESKPPPVVEPAVLDRRLAHLCQALGAERLGVARRLSSTQAGQASAGPFEILGVATRSGVAAPEPGRAAGIPPEVVHRLMVGSGFVDWRRDGTDAIPHELMARWQARRIRGWALPGDRRPSVYAVAIWGEEADPGPRREETARLGLEALARALAPPDWLALAIARPDAPPAPAPLPLEGPSAVAAQLRRGFRRLRGTPGPVLVVGRPERGMLEVAAALMGEACGVEARPVAALLEGRACSRGPWDCDLLTEATPGAQARLLERISAGVADRRRWVFMAQEGLRECVRSGRLRADLYWLMASRQMLLPPLHLRRADLPHLVRTLWLRHAGAEVEIPDSVARALRGAAWPGDLAQLQAEVRRLVHEHPRAQRLRRSWFRRQLLLPLAEPEEEVPQSLGAAVAQVERRLLERALRVCDGNKTQAARQLRMSRQLLYRKLKAHGLWHPARERATGDAKGEPR